MTTKQIVIQKEDAVFWMGENGDWFNAHGKLQHPKIISHFHRSIHKDENGYFLSQQNGAFEEKVYFSYHHTAIFVFEIKEAKNCMLLILNTGQSVQLDPEQLLEKKDKLFINTDDHLIQFNEHALFKISKYLEEQSGKLFFVYQDTRTPIGQH